LADSPLPGKKAQGVLEFVTLDYLGLPWITLDYLGFPSPKHACSNASDGGLLGRQAGCVKFTHPQAFSL
jgi:hypothetical protein